jgi:hypothetical protein
MGKPSDILTRRTEIRMNDKAYQALIEKACRLIFKDGRNVTSKKVNDLLKEQSLVPTWVSDETLSCYCSLLILPERIF